MMILKATQKKQQSFTLSFEDTFFEKNIRWGRGAQMEPPSGFSVNWKKQEAYQKRKQKKS